VEPSLHIIKAQEFQIGLNDQDEAHRVQTAISGLQESRINKLLDTILTQFDDKDAIFRFDSIQLDLGTIRKSNYENELIYRLEEELTRYLSNTILENGRMREGIRVATNEGKLENLEFFLLNGHIKWNSNESETPNKLLESLLKTNPEDLRTLLKTVGKQEGVRKRMTFQFQETTLASIVTLVAKEEGSYMISYKDSIVDYQQKHRLVETSSGVLKTAVWEIILAYIFAESRSFYDKKSFLEYLIKKMGEKYNIGYTALLNILSTVIKADEKLAQRTGDFQKLIVQLKEEQSPQIAAKETPTSKKETINDWLEAFSSYINFGVFGSQSQITSKSDFNDRFLKIIKSRNKLMLSRVDQWLTDHSKKRRLLSIASAPVLNMIIELSHIPSIVAAREFLDVLDKNSNDPSIHSKKFMEKVLSERGELILKLPSSHNYQEKKLLHHLLRNILNISNENEDDFVQFLFETKVGLSHNYEKIIDQFLMTFYQNMGKLVLEGITSEIEQYTNTNSPEFWDGWLEDKIPRWTGSTRLSRSRLLKYVTKRLRKNKASAQLLHFIVKRETVKGKETTNIESNAKLIAEINELSENEKGSSRKKIVLFILEKGVLPWWIQNKDYWTTFNTDFQRLWSKPKERIILVNLLRKNTDKVAYAQLLNDENMKAVLLELDASKSREISTLLDKIFQLLNEKLVPTGAVNFHQYSELKGSILTHLINVSNAKQAQSFLPLLKTWSKSVGIATYDSILETFIHTLRDTWKELSEGTLKKNLESWLKQLTKDRLTSLRNAKKSTSLKAYLSLSHPTPASLKSPKEVLSYLHKIVLSKPEQFNSLLNEADFRTSLIKELSKEHLRELIHQKIGTNQQEFYQQSISYLNHYQSYISANEYKKVNEIFEELILLQLSTKGLNSWGLKDWIRLLFEVVNQVIGKPKNKNLLFRITEKLQAENKEDLVGNQKFVVHLNELTNETSARIFKETKETFDTLLLRKNFRSGVIRGHTTSDFSDFILQETTAQQHEFFKLSIAHLELMEPYVSTQEAKAFRKVFLEFLLLKLLEGTIRSWNMKDWSKLVLHSLNKTMGTSKSSDILFRIREKMAPQMPAQLDKKQKFMVQLTALAQESSPPLLQESNKEFNTLVEANTRKKYQAKATKLKDLEKLVYTKISANQHEFYEQTLLHLKEHKPYLSTREYNAIRRLLLNFLTSKLSSNSLGSWRMKDWGYLLFHSITQVIGKTKNQSIRFTINEKQQIENELKHGEDIRFSTMLEELATDVPQQNQIAVQKKEEDEPYKKLGETKDREYLDAIFISNAGLIILAPFLNILFEKCGLMEQNGFKDELSKYKAIQLLAYAATGKTSREEPELVINKILCGLNLTAPLNKVEDLETSEKETVDSLLHAVTQQWSPLRETSIESLRQTFLQRDGRLIEEKGQFFLKVESKSFDMLLNQIPWNISKIKLSWMHKILEVEWKT
jgi:hypothetical protein